MLKDNINNIWETVVINYSEMIKRIDSIPNNSKILENPALKDKLMLLCLNLNDIANNIEKISYVIDDNNYSNANIDNMNDDDLFNTHGIIPKKNKTTAIAKVD